VTVDIADDIYVGGTWREGPGNLGGDDLFVAHLSKSGQVVWTQRLASSVGRASGAAIAAAGGNIVLGGTFEGVLDCKDAGAPVSAGSDDVVLATLRQTGEVTSCPTLGGAGSDAVDRVILLGSVLVASGEFSGAASWSADAGPTLESEDAGPAGFLARLSVGGEGAWGVALTGARVTALDPRGGFLAGELSRPLVLGHSPVAPPPDAGPALLLSAYNLDPPAPWAVTYGSAAHVGGVVEGPDGLVALAGSFDGSLSFGGSDLGPGNDTIFVAKLFATLTTPPRSLSSGELGWARTFRKVGKGAATPPPRLALTPASEVLIAGSVTSSFDFGGGALQMGSFGGAYVAKLSP
jgi:hypothetical protein